MPGLHQSGLCRRDGGRGDNDAPVGPSRWEDVPNRTALFTAWPGREQHDGKDRGWGGLVCRRGGSKPINLNSFSTSVLDDTVSSEHKESNQIKDILLNLERKQMYVWNKGLFPLINHIVFNSYNRNMFKNHRFMYNYWPVLNEKRKTSNGSPTIRHNDNIVRADSV